MVSMPRHGNHLFFIGAYLDHFLTMNLHRQKFITFVMRMFHIAKV